MIAIRFRMFLLFPLLHLLVMWFLLTSSNWLTILVLGVVLYYPLHAFGFSIGYHKLFAHRSFQSKSFYPYVTTFISMLALYGGPLASSFIHREHHKLADQPGDPHSPTEGWWHAYIGWTWGYTGKGKGSRIIDLLRDYPWMVKVEKYDLLVPLIVYPVLFLASPTLGCIVMIACLLSLHTGLFTNVLTHTKDGEILNISWIAKWINPVFNHNVHHSTHGYDYSTSEVKDMQVWFIQKLLMK